MYLIPSKSTGNELPNTEILRRIIASDCHALRLLTRYFNHTLYRTRRLTIPKRSLSIETVFSIGYERAGGQAMSFQTIRV